MLKSKQLFLVLDVDFMTLTILKLEFFLSCPLPTPPTAPLDGAVPHRGNPDCCTSTWQPGWLGYEERMPKKVEEWQFLLERF